MNNAKARRRAVGSSGPYLDMQISDFGPIKKGSISLRPLTIFIGPNNTGKSYAAMLAHSAMSATHKINPSFYLKSSPKYVQKLEGMLVKLEKTFAAFRSTGEAKCPHDLAAHITRSCINGYEASLKSEIVRNFGSGLPDLTRSGASDISLSITDKGGRTMTYKKGKLALIPLPKFTMHFKAAHDAGAARALRIESVNGAIYFNISSHISDISSSRRGIVWIYSSMQSALLQHILDGIPARSDYFPAARSGILQAHRVITSNVVRNAPYAGIEDIHVPRLSGVVSDFVSAIIDMYPRPGIHYNVGNKIESDIFAGHVNLDYREPDAVPEIVYRRSKVAVPIHRTSSTISELAPFTLYLKHAADRGVIVIEEPEAHLHPRNQVALAGHIVRLVRGGAGIIITTHSALLFEALSQYLQAGSLPPKDRKDALGHKDLFLDKDEIAPHLFREGADGSTVSLIDVSAKEGIEQEEFVKEDRLLNEINMRIEERIYDQTD